jgi:ABC-type branched-subunit amino acid transport system ATPase component
VIEVRGLTKRFGKVLAVDRMSFEVEAWPGHRVLRGGGPHYGGT